MHASLKRADVWLALGVIALGAFMLFQTAQIPVAVNYARVGPRVFPWFVSGVLVLLGIAVLCDALTGRWIKDEADAEDLPPPNLVSFLWLAVGLALYLLTIKYAGFAIASALLFTCVARAFASNRLAFDLALGLALGIAVYAGFHHGLGLTLPGGILEPILG